MELRRFRYCYWGNGVLLQETDLEESILLNHGPYRNTEEAWKAMLTILDGNEPPAPTFADWAA